MKNPISLYDTILAKRTSVENALALLDRAISILDAEGLLIAAAKVDDARTMVRASATAAASDG